MKNIFFSLIWFLLQFHCIVKSFILVNEFILLHQRGGFFYVTKSTTCSQGALYGAFKDNKRTKRFISVFFFFFHRRQIEHIHKFSNTDRVYKYLVHSLRRNIHLSLFLSDFPECWVEVRECRESRGAREKYHATFLGWASSLSPARVSHFDLIKPSVQTRGIQTRGYVRFWRDVLCTTRKSRRRMKPGRTGA